MDKSPIFVITYHDSMAEVRVHRVVFQTHEAAKEEYEKLKKAGTHVFHITECLLD